MILFLLRDGWSVDRIEDLLYKRSGLLGISGVSNDVRALLASDCPRAAEAIEFFVYRIIREIGSLTAALGGLKHCLHRGHRRELPADPPSGSARASRGWGSASMPKPISVEMGASLSRVHAIGVGHSDRRRAVIASHTLAVVRSPAARDRWRTRRAC